MSKYRLITMNDFSKDESYYNYLFNVKGFEPAYKMYMCSSYIRKIRTDLYVENKACYFCNIVKPIENMYPFLLEFNPFKQTLFKDVVLSCDSCRYKELYHYIEKFEKSHPVDYKRSINIYYGTLKSKGQRIAYSMYMSSPYIKQLKSKMYKLRNKCHFCKHWHPEHLLYPFLFKIVPYKQIIFSNVVLSCNKCRDKHLKEYIKFEESK